MDRSTATSRNATIGQETSLVLSFRGPARTPRSRERAAHLVYAPTAFAMSSCEKSIWGYASVVLDRYAKPIGRSQGLSIVQMNKIGGEHPSRYDSPFCLMPRTWAIR